MKKFSLCIGSFLVFILMAGVYFVQAQEVGDLRDLNGQWFKLTLKPQKGLEFTGYDSTAEPKKMNAGAGNFYACVDVEPTPGNNPEAYMRIFDKKGTVVGFGYLYWNAGANLNFLGYWRGYICSECTYTEGFDGFPGMTYDTWLYGYVSVSGKSYDKLKIKGISGEGYIQAVDSGPLTGTYAGFGYQLNGGVTNDKKIPDITPACGAMVWPE